MQIYMVDVPQGHQTEIETLLLNRQYIEVETRFKDVRVVINDDLQTIVVVSQELLDYRCSLPDVELNGTGGKLAYVFAESRLCKNRLLDGTTLFSFGNIFGHNSVLCGARFTDFLASPQCAQMLGRRIKNLVLSATQPQMKVVSFE